MDNDEVFKILQETGNVQLENFDDDSKKIIIFILIKRIQEIP